MIAEDLEFQISQYADGTLPASQRSSVDDLLRSDAQARKLLNDYLQLDGHLAQLRGDPSVQWDRFADRISGHISTALEESQPEIAGRIGWRAWSGRMRIAAAILIAFTAGLVVRHSLHHSPIRSVSPPTASISVEGPTAEIANGTPSEVVTVGPSPRFAESQNGTHYADAVAAHGPSKVVISEAINNQPKVKSPPH